MQNSTVVKFFGLREAPFNVNLDPRFLFVTPQLEKAFSEVIDGIHSGNCFAVITGEVGTGKTTLIHYLRRRLILEGLPTAFVFYTHLNREHLLDFILTDFGISCKTGETINDWKRLENWLVERHSCAQRPVLLVDEAQGLPFSAFEEIRMLLNLETPREKLLQVVLAGELELEEKLKRAQMRELRQRITIRCKTVRLNRDETFDYVRSRLHVGGAESRPLFQPDAMDAIYLHSRGIPRVINALCEHALNRACAEQALVINPHLIREAARTFEWEYTGHLPATEGSVSLTTADPGSVPRFVVPELPRMIGPEALHHRTAVSSVLPSADATETSSEVLLKNRSHSRIPGLPKTPDQESQEDIAFRTLGPGLTASSKREGEIKRSAEFTNSSLRHAISAFTVNMKNRWTGQPRRAQSPFWAWWFYGTPPKWWK